MLDPKLLLVLGQSVPTALGWSDVLEVLSDLQTEDPETALESLGRPWLLKAIRSLATLQGRPWPNEVNRKWRAKRPSNKKLAILLLKMLED